jgi:transaldolase
MAIYIDTASINNAKTAQELGWVYGVTTNPLLLAGIRNNPADIMNALTELNFSQIFYQLVSTTMESMHREAEHISEIVGYPLVLKISPTKVGFQYVSRYRDQIPCCVTAVYSPSQALVAREAGASYVATYVNRATHLMGDGLGMVREIAKILKNSQTEILAASIKSTDEACEALSAGAHHLTLPFDVLIGLIEHPLSVQAVAEFQAKGVGIKC